jgi:hypothetical protein
MSPRGQYTKRIAFLLLVALASLGIFVWSVYKNFAIGIHASDTNTPGTGDQILWVWLLASFVVLVGAGAALAAMLNRRYAVR